MWTTSVVSVSDMWQYSGIHARNMRHTASWLSFGRVWSHWKYLKYFTCKWLHCIENCINSGQWFIENTDWRLSRMNLGARIVDTKHFENELPTGGCSVHTIPSAKITLPVICIMTRGIAGGQVTLCGEWCTCTKGKGICLLRVQTYMATDVLQTLPFPWQGRHQCNLQPLK